MEMPAVMCEIQAPLTRRGFLYLGHPGTGLERPAYSQAPRRGGETGVFVPNKILPIEKTLVSWSGLDNSRNHGSWSRQTQNVETPELLLDELGIRLPKGTRFDMKSRAEET